MTMWQTTSEDYHTSDASKSRDQRRAGPPLHMDLQTYLQWARRCPEEARAQMEYERDCARQSALAAKRPCNKKYAHFVQSSEYRGVFWSHTTREWVARILVDGKYRVIGSYHTEIDAAKAYDRAAEEHDSDPVLNFVDGSLNHKRFAGMERQLWRTPSPVEQKEGGAIPPKFEGMDYNAAARQGGVTGGRDQRQAGSFNNENQAANAQNSPPAMQQQHAMMSLPPPPTVAGPSPTPADERSSEGGGLADEGKEGKKAGRSKNKSMYRGVSWNALVKKWSAVKKTKDGLSRYLGCYQDELDAALAYDRAAAEEDENPIFNFLPDGRLNPHRRMRMDTYLRHLSKGKVQPGVDDEMSRKSLYRGVTWRPLLKKWVSELVLLDGSSLRLGMFDDERAAARAYDRTARLHGRPLSQLNFPSDETSPSRETTTSSTSTSNNSKRRRAGKDAHQEEKGEEGRESQEGGKRRGGGGAVLKEGGRQRPASTLPPSVVDQATTRPRSKRGRHDPSPAQDEEEGDVVVPSVWPVGGGEGQRAGSAGPPMEGFSRGAVGRRDVAARPPSSAASRLRPTMGEAEEKEEEERPAAEEDVAMTLCAFRNFVRS